MRRKPKRRFTSQGITQNLSVEIQQLIWELLDDASMKLSELDDEHQFELSVAGRSQVIIHRQEIPFYEQKLARPLVKAVPIIASVIVLDNGYDKQTMMFADEQPDSWLL